MFDITSSKLLILGIVALLVIGPKDLPALLRTIGKYMGIIKRHAAEFRAQFDEAMRESELEQLKKEVEKVGSEAEATVRAAEHSVDKEVAGARDEVDTLMTADATPAGGTTASSPDAPPSRDAGAAPDAAAALNGAAHPAQDAAEPAKETAASEPAGSVKAGA
jgi:sec-independent protein translocase protein TatB